MDKLSYGSFDYIFDDNFGRDPGSPHDRLSELLRCCTKRGAFREGEWMPTWLTSIDYGEDYFKADPLKRRARRERLHRVHCYVARTGVEAVVASASMLMRKVESLEAEMQFIQECSDARQEGISHLKEDGHGHAAGLSESLFAIITNFKSNIFCAIAGTAARIGELGSELASAIGEPPQRVLARDEQDAPLLLFWAINLCLLCSIASLTLYISAFFARPVAACDIILEPEAVESMQLTAENNSRPSETEGKKFEGIFRVLGVVSLSLISGCGLGLRHPLQGALMSGF